MRIQLIHPPVYLNVHAMTALRPSMPLGLAYVAAVLERSGHTVSVLDAVAEAPDRVTPAGQLHCFGLSPEQIVERIDADAEVLGISNMWSFSWPLVRRIVQLIKQRHPEKIVIAGGEHFTGMPEQSLAEAPLDYIVLGEGEETICELMKLLDMGVRDPGNLPGIAYLRDGEFVRNPARARLRAVDDLPWPAWHLFNLRAYNDHKLINGMKVGSGMTVPILATRGCPYQCTYCSSPGMWTTRWYPRDPVDVVDEIQHWTQTYGARNFPFQDLTAIIEKDWIVRFCNEMIRRDLNVIWQFPSGTRCEVIDDEVAELLARSGGRHLAFAPESGSERTRQLIKKRMTTKALLEAVRASVRHKLNITAFFVIAFPHDTKSDLHQTAGLARKLAMMGVEDIAIGFYFPIPNTKIYDDLVRSGKVDYSDRSLMAPIYANDERIRPENNYCESMTATQLTWAKYWILLNFYPLSFMCHPQRILRVMGNVLLGRETRKLETFLVELRRKLALRIKSLFGSRSASKTATAVEEPVR